MQLIASFPLRAIRKSGVHVHKQRVSIVSTRRLIAAAAGACLLSCAGIVSATEPHGHAVVSVDWVAQAGTESPGIDERVLEIVIRPVVSVNDVHLDFEPPDGVELRPQPQAGESAPPGVSPGEDGRLRLTVGDLQRDGSKSFRFIVHAPSTRSGIAVFSVSGETASGQAFTEKVAWTVGTPAAPTVRNGAAEFPAHVVSDVDP